MTKINLDAYFTSWDEGSTGYFKVGPIKLSVTEDAVKLEQLAKQAAKNIEAEVTYAWDLASPKSDAWWLEWGGYSLEEEIPFHAAISTSEALQKLSEFDPKDNDFECETEEEFKELLFGAYDEELTAKDLQRGFHLWLESLDKEALELLEKDLKSWTKGAR